MIGIWQLVLIFAIILVLFGAGRIPKIMKDLGSGIRSFKSGLEGEDDNFIKNTSKKRIKKSNNKKEN